MSNGVNNNNNNEISIQELRQKLVNVEETAYKDEATKSIFNVYNTEKSDGENSIDFLNKNELSVMINDLEKYDGRISGKADGIIDYDEAMLFVKDFNSRNKGANVNVQNLFGFVNAIFDRYNAQNSPLVETSSVQPVGDPLSQKVVQLNCMVDGKMVTIELEINLHATNDPNFVQILIKKVTKGSEFKQILAEKYGYTGDDAWSKFTNRSLSLSASGTYEIEFNPQFASTPVDSKKDNEGNVNTSYSISVNGIDNFYFPEGFNKDPRRIYNQYQDPEVQQVMNDFVEYIENSIADARRTFDANTKTYGATAWTADFLSKIWNNKYTVANKGNTYSQVEEAISKAETLIEQIKSPDNSLEGVLQHKDFGSIFKELTGVDFDSYYVKSFLEERQKYIKQETVITLYKHVHDTLDNAIDNFEEKYSNLLSDPYFSMMETYKDQAASGDKSESLQTAMSMALMDNSEYAQYGYRQLHLRRAKDDLYNAFYPILGVSRENWDKMFDDLKAQGISPLDFLKQLQSDIVKCIDSQAEQVLGTTDRAKIDSFEENLQKIYEFNKHSAIGRGDLTERVDKYHTSQVIGGAFVSSLMQIALYAVLLGPVGLGAGVSSGFASGSSYAASYLGVELLDRATNDIDDLCNLESVQELALNTGVEFAAGYLFDGILKSKIFGRFEKSALAAENADDVSRMFFENSGDLFTMDTIQRVLGVRGIAAVVGGTKDSTKETFKQFCKEKYNLSNITTAFLVGAVSNALFIRFKNTDWATKQHRFLGKFIEKGPKKEYKTISNTPDTELTQDERDYRNFIIEIKNNILNDLNSQLSGENRIEAENFINNNEDQLATMIMDCFVLEYLAEYNN